MANQCIHCGRAAAVDTGKKIAGYPWMHCRACGARYTAGYESATEPGCWCTDMSRCNHRQGHRQAPRGEEVLAIDPESEMAQDRIRWRELEAEMDRLRNKYARRR